MSEFNLLSSLRNYEVRSRSFMVRCSQCGNEIPELAKFCPRCGAAVTIVPEKPKPTELPKYKAEGLVSRMIRAAKLDESLYEEVEIDSAATTQAMIVVVIASVCSGVGSGLEALIFGSLSLQLKLSGFVTNLVVGSLLALLGWGLWSFITYFIGTSIFGGEATYEELLRCIGFSDSPGILSILSFIPVLGGLIALIAWVWSLIAMVVAIRQALDFSTGKAIFTCIVGWIAIIIILVVIGVLIALPFLLL